MKAIRKKPHEIIALYTLEREINDIYVEGNTDKGLFDHYMRYKKCSKKVNLIEIIDFSDLSTDIKKGLDINSNKNKLIILSILISQNIPTSNVKCVVDKDFDDYLTTYDNGKLLKTDYSCLESYLFCDEVIEKFINLGIGNFPFSASFIRNQFAKVLKSIFCIRLLRSIKFPSAKLLELSNNIDIDKSTGKINFNAQTYLNKFIIKNNLTKDKQNIIDNYNALYKGMKSDTRNNMNGHDYINIFYLYINKIKNTPMYKTDNFDKVLFLTIEPQMLEKHNLFKSILQ